MSNTKALWVVWLLLSLIIGGYLSYKFIDDDKAVFLPGKTSHGHYQIELACNACHTDAFAGGETLQKACLSCHSEELKVADDSHPRSKFTDPRNASRVEQLDARQCVTCHVEHKPEITTTMGVTVPEDFCLNCHQEIENDRPSHTGMEFNTCASAGCHNFHDNTALYEDFLLKHAAEDDLHVKPTLLSRNLSNIIRDLPGYPRQLHTASALTLSDKDPPANINADQKILQDWSTTAHAKSGVNCSTCHNPQQKFGEQTSWQQKPDHTICQTCHQSETKGFLESKHGMRLKQGLLPMQPVMARSPMNNTAHDKSLTCISCHASHTFDVKQAAVDACLGCHNDDHSLAYKQSPHYRLWFQTQNDADLEDSGVSCATCHLPRTVHEEIEGKPVLVQHNQNNNLRPNEKMLRTVCMNCHGLGFSIDALADRDLINKNFNTRPTKHIRSIEMATERIENKPPE